MTTTVFVTVFSSVMLIQIVIIMLSFPCISSVKAGKVTKFCLRKRVCKALPSKLDVEGDVVDVSGLHCLYVCGDSMYPYDIKDGQIVFVSVYGEKQKRTIESKPVVVLKIHGMPLQSQFKLRKFVAYTDQNSDWENVYQANREFIKTDKGSFIKMMQKKAARCMGNGSFVLSETYESKHAQYSLHPVDDLYAKVEYVTDV